MVSTDILGIPVDEIPQTWTPVGVVALIECLDNDGDQRFLHAQELGDWAAVFESTGDDE